MLQRKFPTHAFVGEESVAAADGKLPEIGDEPTWFVDPLDGTTNFVHAFPFSCVSIGLAVKKKPVVGVVFNPISNECFTAVVSNGARLNGKPISVSKVSDLGKALIGTEIGVSKDAATVDAIMGRVRACVENARSLRCSGCVRDEHGGRRHGTTGRVLRDRVRRAVGLRGRGGDRDGGGRSGVRSRREALELTARRVLCGNPDIAPALTKVLTAIPDGPLEPQAP